MERKQSADLQANTSQQDTIQNWISYWQGKVYTLNSDPTFYHRFEDQFKNANSHLAMWKQLESITSKP